MVSSVTTSTDNTVQSTKQSQIREFASQVFGVLAYYTFVSALSLDFADAQLVLQPVVPISEKQKIVGDHCRVRSPVLVTAATQHDLGLLETELITPLLPTDLLLFELVESSHVHEFLQTGTAHTISESP